MGLLLYTANLRAIFKVIAPLKTYQFVHSESVFRVRFTYTQARLMLFSVVVVYEV